MSFEVFYGGRTSPKSIAPGHVSISKAGVLCLHRSDLARVKIENYATILVNPAICAIALRAPLTAPDKGFAEPAVLLRHAKTGGSSRLWLKSAIKAAGLNIDAVARPLRVELMVKENMLVIPLAGGAKGAKAGR